jgi:hypothetical protein
MEITIDCLIPKLTISLQEEHPKPQDVADSLLNLLAEINNI